MGFYVNPWLLLLITTAAAAKLADVYHLRGEGDFRFATLRWDYPKQIAVSLFGFQIHYCELQAWGSNRCRTKVVERSTGIGEEPTAGTQRAYSVVITGLKMSTNYSFEVRPMESRKTRYLAEKSPDNTIIVNTKGFSAVARVCLPDSSEVEVSTGPYFSGRIGVEGTRGLAPECSLNGDGSSPNSSYVLRISHSICGSVTNATAVATFILVQENLPILTHSTRRFLVLCTFHPETLTVRAGLNLPGTGLSGTGSGSVETESTEIEQLPELTGNDVHAMPLLQELQMAAANQRHHKQSDSGAEIVFTTAAVVIAIVGLLLAVWWFHPRKSSPGQESILSEEVAESVCDDPLRESYITDEDRSSDESNQRSRQVFTISKSLTRTTHFCEP